MLWYRSLRLLRSVILASVLALPMASLHSQASADEGDIAVDWTVDAVVGFGSVAGVPISQTEAAIIKGIVRCAIKNIAVLNCARHEVVQRLPLPEQAQPLAGCAIAGMSIDECGLAGVVKDLPEPVRGIVVCIDEHREIGTCGQSLPLDATQKQAFEVIEKLKADARSELGTPGSGAIRNIIAISEGIRDEDWPKVSVAAGAELYKAVATVVLQKVIPAGDALGPVIRPFVDVVVQSRVDLVVDLIQAFKAGDKGRIGQVAIEFYLTAHVEMGCTFFKALPPGSFTDTLREATCGNIGEVIRAVGGVGGDVVEVIVDIFKDLGIDPFGIFAKESCGTTANYYARNMAVCTKHSAFLTLTNPQRADQIKGEINQSCRKHFLPCNKNLFGSDSSALDEVCDPQHDRFARDVQGLVDGLADMATSHAKVHFNIPEQAPQLGDCRTSEALQAYLPGCVRALGAQARGFNGQDWSLCGRPEWNLPRPDVLGASCTAAACAPATIKFAACRNYAARAIGTLQLARELPCDPKVFTGPRWTPNFNDHLQFCVGAAPNISNFEDAKRRRIYDEFRIACAMPPGIAQLRVAQLPNGDFNLSGDGYPLNTRVVIRVSGPAARSQDIPSNFSNPKGHFEATLQRGTVCNAAGTITFVADDKERPPSPPVNATCAAPSAGDMPGTGRPKAPKRWCDGQRRHHHGSCRRRPMAHGPSHRKPDKFRPGRRQIRPDDQARYERNRVPPLQLDFCFQAGGLRVCPMRPSR